MRRNLLDHISLSYGTRKAKNFIACVLLGLATLLAIVPLVGVFGYVLSKGLPALDWSFFSELPKPVGETGGGIANAIVGTAVLVFLGSILGIFWGIGVGLYLSEYGTGKFAGLVRFSADLLSSVPSIIIGLFVYTIVVLPMKRFSALAGGIALGLIMIPTIARTTEELLKMVPTHIREAGLALGLPRWKVILHIVLRGSIGSIITGVMLAIARAAGETAPLLFTAFGNRLWNQGLDQPIASIPVQIYTYAISPYDDWHRQAWAGALVLVSLVFIMNILTRFVIKPADTGRE